MKLLVLILILSFSSSVFAKTVARVIDVKGNAFVFTDLGVSKSLKYGSKVEDISEVMVEDGGTLSLINNQGHVFHVNGGSLLKFYKGVAEVKNGQVWVVSRGQYAKGIMNTANSVAKYGEGQFIYSFDNHTGKTQILVLTGDVQFSNVLEPDLLVKVPSGYFSFVDKKYENGMPRTPTRVGDDSYDNMKKLFANFDSLKDSALDQMIEPKKRKIKTTSRSIASVVEDQFTMGGTHHKPQGKLIKITTYGNTRTPASVPGAGEYYQKLKQKKAWKYKPAKTNKKVQIKYHGFNWEEVKPQKVQTQQNTQYNSALTQVKKPSQIVIKTNKVQRMPASVGKKSQLIQELAAPKSSFEKSLEQGYKQEKRHAEEVNGLIDELKSFKQDYKKDY